MASDEVLIITTAYEQGVGHANRPELSNPYARGDGRARLAWDLGREFGLQRAADRALNAPGDRHLTVTTDAQDNAVLVSWQDDEHRILEIVWERDAPAVPDHFPDVKKMVAPAVLPSAAPREVPRLTPADIDELVLRVPYEGDTTTPWRAEWTEQIGAPLIRAVESRVRALCGVAP